MSSPEFSLLKIRDVFYMNILIFIVTWFRCAIVVLFFVGKK